MELEKLDRENSQLQQQINALNSKSESADYNWQTSDSDKPGGKVSAYGVSHLLIVFLISVFMGIYLNRLV